MGICLALILRYDVSMRLFKIAGRSLRYKGVDIHYITMLLNPAQFTLDQCNTYLRINGYKVLFPETLRRKSAEVKKTAGS